MSLRKSLIKLAKRLENTWQFVDLGGCRRLDIEAGWYVSEFMLQGSVLATPRIVVQSADGKQRVRRLDGSHSGRNRMLFFLPSGTIRAVSKSIEFKQLARVSTVEGRARVLLICGRYLVDFFSLRVLFRMIAMQFQSRFELSTDLLHFYSPEPESYLRNVQYWERFRGFEKALSWWHRKIRIAVLIEHQDQRAELLELLLPPDLVLLAGDTTEVPQDIDYVLPLKVSEHLRFASILMLKRAILKQNRRPQMVYTDHDYRFDEKAGEQPIEPAFKPKPSLAYLYCFNYIGPTALFARDVLRQTAPNELLNTDIQYHLALECFAKQRVLHVDEALFISDKQSLLDTPEPVSTASAWPNIQWQRRGQHNALVADPAWPAQPSVDLIIPTRDGLAVLRPCIESILEKTDYRNYQVIIVDNGSELTETKEFLNTIVADQRVTVVDYPGEFNYSAINNFAADQGHGDYIGLINNDIEVIDADWLTQMMVWATQTSVGVVGAKLLFGNGKVQHAGVTIGMGNAAGHIHRLEEGDAPGYQNRCVATQNMMAVTAACLITPRTLFEQQGKLDAEHLAVAYNDIDYCLRIEALGMDIIWTPEARLYHHESVSRGDDMSEQHIERYFRELGTFQKRWKTKGFVDKYYSRHLRINDEGVFPQIAREAEDELTTFALD